MTAAAEESHLGGLDLLEVWLAHREACLAGQSEPGQLTPAPGVPPDVQ